jgi:hypothetical protein
MKSILIMSIFICAFSNWSCTNPATPREPIKFSAGATFEKRIDSATINGRKISVYGKAISSIQTKDGGYAITGFIYLFGEFTNRVFVLKTNGLGTTQWFNIYEQNRIGSGYSIIQLNEGDYIIGGTIDENQGDMFLLKVKQNGEQVWFKSYDNNSRRQECFSLIQADDGGFVLAGHDESPPDEPIGATVWQQDVAILKTDANGNFLWRRGTWERGKDAAICIRKDVNGNYAIAGYYEFLRKTYFDRPPGVDSIPTGKSDMFFVKFNASGQTLAKGYFDSQTAGGVTDFTQILNQQVNDEAKSLELASDGGYILSGTTTVNGNIRGYLVKVNSDGNRAWDLISSLVSPFGENQFLYSRLLSNDDLIVTGFTDILQSGQTTRSANNILLAKVDKLGNIIWEKSLGKEFQSEMGLSVSLANDGGFIITGEADGRPYILKTNSAGSLDESDTTESANSLITTK